MPWSELSVCLIVAAVTVLIRVLPFAVSDLSGKKRKTEFIDRLSGLLTPALIGMLVIYCLKDVNFGNTSALATAISLAICVGTYLWRKNTLLSIVLPTVVYMVLIRVL